MSIPQIQYDDEKIKNTFVQKEIVTPEIYNELNETVIELVNNNNSIDSNISIGNSVHYASNIEAMQSMNLSEGELVITKGFYQENDGGSAKYIIKNSGTADGYSVISISNGLFAHLMVENFVNVKWFGAKIDGSTDDSEAFNRVVNFITGSKTNNIEGYTLYVPPGTMKINNQIRIDIGCMKLKCDGTAINATGVTGTAILIDSNIIDSPYLYNNATNYIESFRLYGTRKEGNYGIAFAQSNAQVRELNAKNVVVHDFDKGVRYGKHSYCTTLQNCSIYNCNTCIDNLAMEDSGERLSFIDTALFNSTLAVNNQNPNGSMNFLHCSIDYVEQAVNNGANCSTFLTDCHLEWNYTNKPFIVIGGDGSCVIIKGGYITHTATNAYKEYAIENSANPSGGLYIDGTFIAGIKAKYLINKKPFNLSNIKSPQYASFPFIHYKEYTSYKNLKYIPNCIIADSGNLEIEEDYIKWTRTVQGGSVKLIKKADKYHSIWDFVLDITATKTLNDGCWVQFGFGIKDINGDFKPIYLQGDQSLKDRLNSNLNTFINVNTTLRKNDVVKNLTELDDLYICKHNNT